MEQNQFKFTEDLDAIKAVPNQKPVDPKEKARRKERESFLRRAAARVETEKTGRIVDDSNDVCPYTGNALNGVGEFDHIVPRAETKVFGGGAFNSEANLIFCSACGNRDKSAKKTALAELNPKYLRAVFQTESRAEVEKQISQHLPAPREFTNFANLRRDHPEQARALRHALFVEDLRADVIRDFLRTENKARVNGTQKFFVRKLRESLERQFNRRGWAAPKFAVFRVHARDVAATRRALLPPEWKKPRGPKAQQGAMSHIADAAMAFAALRGLDSETARATLPDSFSFRVVQMTRRPPWEQTLRRQGKRKPKREPKSAPVRFSVFGDKMFGERFLPILVAPDGVRIGFSPGNSVAVKTGGANLLCAVAQFLRETKAPDLAELQERAKNEPSGFVRLSINKRAAFDALQIAWQREAETPAVQILKALRYTVSKKEIDKNRITEMEKATPKEFRRSAEFKSPHFRMPALKRPRPFSTENGAIVYPAFFAWRKLLENPRIQKWLESSEKSDHELQDILRDHFVGEKTGQKHRSVFSLPVLAGSAVKSGWRIRRRSPQGDIFQTHETKKFVSRGFAAADGVADFQKPVLLRELVRPAGKHPDYLNALTPIGNTAQKTADEVAAFGCERILQTENGVGVCALAPCTAKGAMNIRIAIATADLLKIAKWCGVQNPHPRDIPPVLFEPDNDHNREWIQKILAIPGNPPLIWGKKGGKKFMRLVALGPDHAEVEVRTKEGNAELWEMFNRAAPKTR